MAPTDPTPEKDPPAWYDRFLASLRSSPNVSAAARAAGINRDTAYAHRMSDGAFAAAWDSALDEAVDALVGEAYRRAFKGVARRKGIFYEGKKVATEIITEYSDTLTIFLLKAHRPETYRERLDVTSAGQPLTKVYVGIDAEAV